MGSRVPGGPGGVPMGFPGSGFLGVPGGFPGSRVPPGLSVLESYLNYVLFVVTVLCYSVMNMKYFRYIGIIGFMIIHYIRGMMTMKYVLKLLS